jgi:hypothetical protein
MPFDSHAGDAELRNLRAQLGAERAAVEQWRRIAQQRSEEFAALRKRPSVRVLLGVESRLAPMAGRIRSARRRVHAAAERLALSAGALQRVGRRSSQQWRGIASTPASRAGYGTVRPRWRSRG